MKFYEIPARRSDPYKPKRVSWIRIKSIIRSKLRKYPVIDTAVVKIWRVGRFFSLKIVWKLEALIGSWRGTHVCNMDVDKIYWVHPHKIVFSSLQEFGLHDFKGHILGGDWDRLEKRFDTLDLYQAIKQVCIEKNSWTDTVFYQRALDDLKNDRFELNYKDERDLDEKCRKIEALYRSIQSNGYVSQKELFLAGQIQDPLVAEEEIMVSIGRFGDLLFSDGAHRLVIAKLLGVPAIPVKVTVRHKDWIKFRDELVQYGKNDQVNKDGKLSQPCTHPDLSDLPVSHASENRFQLIKDNTLVKQGRLLDIGANLGYFCHCFEEQGLDCYAVENLPSAAYFLKRLARAENRRFKIITESFLDSSEIRNTRFNIVLALNIFHHFLKTPEDFEKLVDFLKSLQTEELFFEPHLPDGHQMQGAYKSYSPDEFVKFITSNSELKTSVFLGVMKDGKPLYKLY
jgi:hypothetical protein